MSATDLDATNPATEKVLSDATGGAATGRNFVLNTRPLFALRKWIAKKRKPKST